MRKIVSFLDSPIKLDSAVMYLGVNTDLESKKDRGLFDSIKVAMTEKSVC
jgi:hypothetical protein